MKPFPREQTKNFEPMRIAQWELTSEEWGDETNPESDWSLANHFSTFSHRETCKFIFWIGSTLNDIDHWKEKGFSPEFLDRCFVVQKAGYKYVCFFT